MATVTKSRSTTFRVPESNFGVLKCSVTVADATVKEGESIEDAGKRVSEIVRKELMKDVLSHLSDSLDIVTADKLDTLAEYIEKEIDEN